MVSHLPEQPDSTNRLHSFSAAIMQHMKNKAITQSKLVQLSRLSKTTISRVLRNTNDKGASYRPTMAIVMAISVGLKLTYQEYEELLYIAYPETGYMKEVLGRCLTVDEANEILYDNGLPLLGNMKED